MISRAQLIEAEPADGVFIGALLDLKKNSFNIHLIEVPDLAHIDAAASALAAALYEWDESKHPRQEAGTDRGGEFRPSSSVGTVAHSAAKDIERGIFGNKTETLFVLDQEGKTVFRKGGKRRIVLSMEEASKLYPNYMLTHNHPNNTSLSNDDLATAASHNLGEIRAATKDGTYWARPGPMGWPESWQGQGGAKRIESEIVRTSLPLRKKYQDMVNGGTPLRIAQEQMLHEINGIMAKNHGIHYGLEERTLKEK